MDFDNSFCSSNRSNAFDDLLFRQNQERQRQDEIFRLEEERQRQIDRDYGAMHFAPRGPMM